MVRSAAVSVAWSSPSLLWNTGGWSNGLPATGVHRPARPPAVTDPFATAAMSTSMAAPRTIPTGTPQGTCGLETTSSRIPILVSVGAVPNLSVRSGRTEGTGRLGDRPGTQARRSAPRTRPHEPGEAFGRDIAAGDDDADAIALHLGDPARQERGDSGCAARFHDHLQPFEQERHGCHELVVRDGLDPVDEIAVDLERQLARSGHLEAVGDGAGDLGQPDPATGLERLPGVVAGRRLHPDHARGRVGQIHRR